MYQLLSALVKQMCIFTAERRVESHCIGDSDARTLLNDRDHHGFQSRGVIHNGLITVAGLAHFFANTSDPTLLHHWYQLQQIEFQNYIAQGKMQN